jgi:predicted metal-binding protein
MTTVFVCVTCRGPAGEDDRPGRRLFDALTGEPGVTAQPVECLSVCKRPCTIALAAPGKWTYLIGDLNAETAKADIIAMTARYGETADGIVPWRERPTSFRKGVVARVPPVA